MQRLIRLMALCADCHETQIVINNAPNFTARWNSFLNCAHACIWGANSAGTANNAVTDSNTFNGMAGDAEGTPMGAITLQGDNILVENSTGQREARHLA
jgi:hypothetical protein